MWRFRSPSPCHVWLLFAATVLAGLVVPACEDDPNEEEDVARLAAMKQEILDFVGDATCTGSADCATIAFGAKPCGGPWRYLVYSKSSVDEEALKDLVDRYNRFNDILNHRHGWYSTCDVISPPATDCVDGHCVGVRPGAVPE